MKQLTTTDIAEVLSNLPPVSVILHRPALLSCGDNSIGYASVMLDSVLVANYKLRQQKSGVESLLILPMAEHGIHYQNSSDEIDQRYDLYVIQIPTGVSLSIAVRDPYSDRPSQVRLVVATADQDRIFSLLVECPHPTFSSSGLCVCMHESGVIGLTINMVESCGVVKCAGVSFGEGKTFEKSELRIFIFGEEGGFQA